MQLSRTKYAFASISYNLFHIAHFIKYNGINKMSTKKTKSRINVDC